jgi:hypothetical protein
MPNPFNPVTNIRYSLKEDGFIQLSIYDILGREVATLVKEKKLAGEYEVQFDGSFLSSGIYICRLSTKHFIAVRKLQIMK